MLQRKPAREFAVAALDNFNYGLLSREREAHLRHLATTIHSIGCKQTAEGVAIGKMLIEAKADFKMLIEPKAGFRRGQFSRWCESEAGYRKRRAELLMSLANFAVKEPEVLRVPLSAGYLLAAPSAPKHVVQQVLSVARDGGRVKVSWVEMLLEEANEKQSEPERRSTSEVAKIAKLIAGALGPSQATKLRKLLEAAGAASIQRFVYELQSQLQDELRGIAPSSEQSADQQVVAL
jgi:hypothetical protein